MGVKDRVGLALGDGMMMGVAVKRNSDGSAGAPVGSATPRATMERRGTQAERPHTIAANAMAQAKRQATRLRENRTGRLPTLAVLCLDS